MGVTPSLADSDPYLRMIPPKEINPPSHDNTALPTIALKKNPRRCKEVFAPPLASRTLVPALQWDTFHVRIFAAHKSPYLTRGPPRLQVETLI